jgi:Domain of unknown function (DUF4142)
MKPIATFALASALLSTAAYAQSVGEKTGVNSTLGIAPKTEDFIKEAAMSDMLEIDAAKIAQQKGDPQEKTFAGEMITDHTKTSHRVERLGVRRNEVRASYLARRLVPEKARQIARYQAGKLRQRIRSDASQRAQGCGVALRALCEGWRRSEVEGLGRQNPADLAAPSRDGAGHEQEPEVRKLFGAFGRPRKGPLF